MQTKHSCAMDPKELKGFLQELNNVYVTTSAGGWTFHQPTIILEHTDKGIIMPDIHLLTNWLGTQ